MAATVYEVRLIYDLKDKASPGLSSIARQAGEAEKSTGSLVGSLKGLAATLGAGFAISKAKGLFVDFNSEVEQSKISISAISMMFNKNQTFDKAMTDASGLFDRYQEAAKASTATTADFLSMHKTLMPALSAAGVKGKQMEDLVKGSVIAAPMFGFDADYLARDIQSMLSGMVQNKDKAAMIMLASMGLDKETFNRKAKEEAGYAVKTLETLLTGPAVQAAAKAQEGSYKGVVSTLEDMAQILGSKMGKPIFTAVTEEIKKWNMWLTKNEKVILEIGRSIADGIVTGFGMLKDSIAFIIDHKAELLAIAAAYTTVKAAGAVSSVVGAARGAASIYGAMGAPGAGAVASFASAEVLAWAASPVVIGAIAAAVITYAGYQLYQSAQSSAAKGAAIEGSIGGSGAMGKHYNVWDAIKGGDSKTQALGFQAGLYNAAGDLDMKKVETFALRFGNSTSQVNEIMEAFVKASKDIPYQANIIGFGMEQAGKSLIPAFDMIKGALYNVSGGLIQWHTPDHPSDDIKAAAVKKDKPINVNISRVEVTSDEPDRFVVGLVKMAERAIDRPGQSASALRY
jgi:hypothetical protein